MISKGAVSALVFSLISVSGSRVWGLEDKPSVKFGDGLSVVLPSGWVTTTLMTEAAPEERGAHSFENPDVLTMLLHAKPADKTRTARMAIVRDATFGGDNHLSKTKILMRLNEIATQQGYKATNFSGKETDKTVYGEVTGVSGDGQRRVFAALAYIRFPKPDIRCYWQYDESDALARQEFQTSFSSVAMNDVNAASSLWNTAAATTAATPPSADRPLSALPPPGSAVPTAASPVTASTLSATPLNDKVTAFVSANSGNLVVVEGQNGRGSGFICRLDGQPFLVTNTHVLSNNPQPRFTAMDGKAVTPGPAFLAVDHDMAKIAAPNATTMMELMTEADGAPKIGDAISVLGNSEGAGVIKPLQGKIVGLGPNLIEVDAPFVSGNSGSPIIHVETGKVIGIATYVVIRKVNGEAEKGMDETIRRFGYRLDSVKQWEPVMWPKFYAQSDQVQKILTNGEEFATFLGSIKGGELPDRSANSKIQRSLDIFQSRAKGGARMSAADQASAIRELLGNLRSATRSDVMAFDTRLAYDYFRRQVADESRFRDALYDNFTKALDKFSR